MHSDSTRMPEPIGPAYPALGEKRRKPGGGGGGMRGISEIYRFFESRR